MNVTFSASDERRNKREREAAEARYTSRRTLLMEHLEKKVERVRAARTSETIDVWLG